MAISARMKLFAVIAMYQAEAGGFAVAPIIADESNHQFALAAVFRLRRSSMAGRRRPGIARAHVHKLHGQVN